MPFRISVGETVAARGILHAVSDCAERRWPEPVKRIARGCVLRLAADGPDPGGTVGLQFPLREVAQRYAGRSVEEVLERIRKGPGGHYLLGVLVNELFDYFLCMGATDRLPGEDAPVCPPFRIPPATAPARVRLYPRLDVPGPEEILDFFGPSTFQGKSVLVKPNFVSSEPWPVTVDSALVHATLLALRQAGAARVMLLEMPSRHEPPDNPRLAALRRHARRAKLSEWIDPAGHETTLCTPQSHPGLHFRHFLPKAALEADVVFSIANFKEHESHGFTGALKNMVGLLPGWGKILLHSLDFEERCAFLLDLALLLPIRACIVDCRRLVAKAQQFRRGSRQLPGFGFVFGTDPIQVDRHVLAAARAFTPELDNRPNYLETVET